MKNQKAKGMAKSALAAALSLTMTMSGMAVMPAATVIADDVAPIKTLNFNKGLQEFRYDKDKGTGDVNFEIVKSPQVIYAKFGDQVEISPSGEIKDKTDANGYVYTGNGGSAKYVKTALSNQPVTATDDVKGTALVIDKTVAVDQLVKEKSAAIEGDTAATEALDKEIKLNEVARDAFVSKSQVYMSNPFYGQTADAYTLTYWEYVPEGTAEDAALIAFEGDNTAVSLYYDADNAATPAGTWAQVAAVFAADGVKFYVNGAAVADSYMTTAGDYALSTVTGAQKILFGGSDLVDTKTIYNSRLDDVTFYAAALTDEQIASAYETEKAKLSPAVDVDAPTAVYSLSDASQFVDNGENTVTIEDATVAGRNVKAAHIAANTSNQKKVGLYLKENPFANEDGSVEGITVGYWYKQELGKRDKKTPNYYSMMFVDDEKFIYNGKTESESGDGRSYLYVDNALSAIYKEGSTYQVGNYLKNTYTFTLEAEAAATVTEDAKEWRYVTLVATNGGIQMYINGERYENASGNSYGTRFSDGYYASIPDQNSPITLNGTVGGANNQLATQLMTFVGREDTKIYFGWQSTDLGGSTGNAKSSGSWVYNVSCYSGAMDDAEVKALYDKELKGGDEPDPSESPAPDVTYGDVDNNGQVEAADALSVLKAVVKLTTLTDSQVKAADVDGDGQIAAADALLILKKVVNLIQKFPVEG